MIHHGECLEIMQNMDSNSVDTIITDPPYALEFMGKGWDKVLPPVEVWIEALRVAKPGAMLMAFGGTRTYHRLTCAIEDAGWEIRDCVMWVYGSGFPKSHDISKGIDKAAGKEREVTGKSKDSAKRKATSYQADKTIHGYIGGDGEGDRIVTAPATPEAQTWDGYGTALKPSWEPIVLAMKPLDGTFAQNALKWGVAGLWIDGGRVAASGQRGDYDHRRRPNNVKAHNGFEGKAFKVAARGMTMPQPQGRWPANLIHDGSEEVVQEFPKTGNSARPKSQGKTYTLENRKVYQVSGYVPHNSIHDDFGSAARFFYCAKSSKAERNKGCEGMDDKIGGAMMANAGEVMGLGGASLKGEHKQIQPSKNNHPTVKPLALMRYLCRLTRMPDGGIVLDPFMGSGTTGIAAKLEDRNFIGIEKETEYCEIAKNRIEAWEQEEVGVDDQQEFGF